jgi:hypothetical protein
VDGVEGIAAICSQALGRPIRSGGNDLATMEQRLKAMPPGWHALDLLVMFSRYHTDGASPRQTTSHGSPVRYILTGMTGATEAFRWRS